jgi:hypothetical protein
VLQQLHLCPGREKPCTSTVSKAVAMHPTNSCNPVREAPPHTAMHTQTGRTASITFAAYAARPHSEQAACTPQRWDGLCC